ncbi:T9SS type A sorting domain-containing protein [Rasiella sp. SM2506]|uniref:T9SS type A sorting domain-containing protein n=1 Tax=Rasiella sp. SM2506 TaxID=3423914 RepID=UPI003D78DFFE
MKNSIFFFVVSFTLIGLNIFAQDFQDNSRITASDVYVMEFFTRPGEFGTIPLSGPYYPIPNVITGNAFTMLGGDFNNSGTLYTFVYQDPEYLLGTVDLSTGAVNYAADVSGVVSTQQFLSQLSYNVTNDTFYAISHDPNNTNGSQLYSLNISTGVLTPVGPLNIMPNAIAFEIDNNGVAYSADAVTGNFYTIDLNTGVATMIGNSNPNGFYPVGQGFSIDHSNNTMYAVLQNSDGVIRSRFYTVNLTNGALTDLGDGSSRKYSLFALASETLGVTSNNLFETSIYPNPTNGNFTIDLGKEYTDVTIQISNLLGQTISSSTYASTKIIDQEIAASAGMYFVNVSTAEGNSKTLKIVKK